MVEEPTENPFVKDPPTSFDAVESLSESEAKAEAANLREAIEYHDHQYYVVDSPVIADSQYDALFNRLTRLETAFDLPTENSPTQRVGGEPVDSLTTVEHVTPMLSLDSSEDEADVREWHTRLTETAGEVEYSVEPKFDGISVEIVYDDGRFDRAVTRGDGEEGDDISHTVKTIRSVPLRLPSAPALLAVRGEIYMPRSAFHEMNEARVQAGEDPFANPRNAAAGTVRQLDPSIAAERPLEIYFYDVLESSASLESQRDAMELLRELGLRLSDRNQFVTEIDAFIEFRDRLLAIRDDMEAEADGVVAKVNAFATRETLGATARHPRWAFAYKFPARRGETTIQRIVVQVGRTGKLTPVALLDPVEVTGVTISRATLHNERIIKDLGVSEGARVSVERAGDVIPEIADVIESAPGEFSMPATCPVCASEVVTEGEYHFCTGGMTCDAQLRRSVQHFTARDAMDIEGIGETIANQLVEENLISSVADLYDLEKVDLVRLPAFGDKSAQNVLTAIENSKSPRLDRFIYALGIRHVGSERARDLAASFTIEELMNASVAELRRVEDIGPEVAQSIHSFFDNENNRTIVTNLLGAGITPEPLTTGDELQGLTVVFTGSITGYTREEITELVEQHGGSVTSSVSGNTDYLIIGENPGSTKLSDAESLDVPVVEFPEFRSQYLAHLD